LQQKTALLQQQLAATMERSRQIDNDNEQKEVLYTAALERILQMEEETKQLAANLQKQQQEHQNQVQEDRRHQGEIAAITERRLRQISTKLRTAVSELRHQISEHLQAFQIEIQTYKTLIHSIATKVHTDPQRVMELTQIEAFKLWVHTQPTAEAQTSAQTLLQKVSAKMNHTLQNLKAELHQTIAEKDELQAKIEQQEETRDTFEQRSRVNFGEWTTLIEQEKFADPDNLISATQKNLAPPVSIYQYYQAYKPILLTSNNLPDIKAQSCLTKEQFQTLWSKANSDARDLLIFMWVLKDLILPKALAEVTSANPNFYLTRFCISALTHMAKHHEEFYSNIDNRKSLPQIEPYETDTINEIQELANQQFPEFLSSLDILAAEDTTILHEATQQHQNLVRKFPDSFPTAFHRIQLHGYITRALDDRKTNIATKNNLYTSCKDSIVSSTI
jgi:hypothetical protein